VMSTTLSSAPHVAPRAASVAVTSAKHSAAMPGCYHGGSGYPAQSPPGWGCLPGTSKDVVSRLNHDVGLHSSQQSACVWPATVGSRQLAVDSVPLCSRNRSVGRRS
jgi:hypothetical protein